MQPFLRRMVAVVSYLICSVIKVARLSGPVDTSCRNDDIWLIFVGWNCDFDGSTFYSLSLLNCCCYYNATINIKI
jgi:hypothetical protein